MRDTERERQRQRHRDRDRERQTETERHNKDRDRAPDATALTPHGTAVCGYNGCNAQQIKVNKTKSARFPVLC